jgi:hypothetical protein
MILGKHLMVERKKLSIGPISWGYFWKNDFISKAKVATFVTHNFVSKW